MNENIKLDDQSMERLQLLILARLCTRARKPPARSALMDTLRRYLEHALSRAEQRAVIERALDDLAERGDIEHKPLGVTGRGKARLSESLGVAEKDLEWSVIRKRHLTAAALGLALSRELDKRISNASGLRAAVLWQRRDLPMTRPPTLTQAVDALVWRALGVDTDAPLTLDRLRAHVLQGLVESRRTLTRAKLEAFLAARAAGSERTDTDALRVGLVQGWLTARADSGPADPDEIPPVAFEAAAQDRDVSLDELARAVNRVAATVTDDGRFGERKVFISAVWQRLAGQPVCAGMSFERFKELLVRANREDLVWLHRADLVPLMPEAHVLASETRHGNATFHFVEIQPERSAP